MAQHEAEPWGSWEPAGEPAWPPGFDEETVGGGLDVDDREIYRNQDLLYISFAPNFPSIDA